MEGSEGIWGPSGVGSWRVNLRSILGQSEGHSWTQPTYLSLGPGNSLHLAVGRALSLKYTNIWVLGWLWVGTGIALPATPPVPTTPGTPLPPPTWSHVRRCCSRQAKCGRGAQIRRPTHLEGVILRDKDYYRGI